MARLIAVGGPTTEPAPLDRADALLGAAASERSSGRSSAPRASTPAGYRSNDFEHAVRMDPNGAITAGQGQVQQFAALAAYVCRVGDLIGELLGMGKLAGIDGALAQGTECLIFRKATGDTWRCARVPASTSRSSRDSCSSEV